MDILLIQYIFYIGLRKQMKRIKMSQSRDWDQLTVFELERCYERLVSLTVREELPSFTTKKEWLDKIRSLPMCPLYPPLTLSYLYTLPKHRLQMYCQSYDVDIEQWTRDHMLLFLMNRLGLDYQELQWWKMSKQELTEYVNGNDSLCSFHFPTKSFMIHCLWKHHRFQDNSIMIEDMERSSDKLETEILQWMFPI